MNLNLNSSVTAFLDELDHPLRKEIETLREIILETDHHLTENVKWNGPNYSLKGEDIITMKIQPPLKIQLILHRGAKAKVLPKSRWIQDESGLLVWKSNDRAVITLENLEVMKQVRSHLQTIVHKWIIASRTDTYLHLK